jgi:hypothetical protein
VCPCPLPLVSYLLLSSPSFLSASMSDLAQIKQRSCQVTDASLSFDGEASSDPLYISLFPSCCDVSSRCLASSPTIFIQPLGGFLGHKLWPGWKQCSMLATTTHASTSTSLGAWSCPELCLPLLRCRGKPVLVTIVSWSS